MGQLIVGTLAAFAMGYVMLFAWYLLLAGMLCVAALDD